MRFGLTVGTISIVWMLIHFFTSGDFERVKPARATN
jgi:hypothetical protein